MKKWKLRHWGNRCEPLGMIAILVWKKSLNWDETSRSLACREMLHRLTMQKFSNAWEKSIWIILVLHNQVWMVVRVCRIDKVVNETTLLGTHLPVDNKLWVSPHSVSYNNWGEWGSLVTKITLQNDSICCCLDKALIVWRVECAIQGIDQCPFDEYDQRILSYPLNGVCYPSFITTGARNRSHCCHLWRKPMKHHALKKWKWLELLVTGSLG